MKPLGLAIALPLAVAVVACAHGGSSTAPAASDPARLYRRSCSSCHRLKAPAEHDAATWRRAVERFGSHLSPEERRAVADYLVAHARSSP